MERPSQDQDVLRKVFAGHIQRHGIKDTADTILETLSPWDILHLRRRLLSLDVDKKAFATWANLPLEILYHITDYLTTKDILACRLVSREWRKAWLQDGLLMRVLKVYYPGLIKANPRNLTRERLLLDVLHSYRRKKVSGLKGTFVPWFSEDPGPVRVTSSGVPTYRLTANLRDDPTVGVALSPMYSDGKVAWQIIDQQFIVDDLKTARRSVFIFPVDRRKHVPSVRLVALTGKILVVLSQSKPEKLNIMLFNTEEWVDITLSGPLHQCYAQDDRLVAVCGNGEVLFWQHRTPCVNVNVTDESFHAKPALTQETMGGGLPGVLIHPSSSDVVFLVWIHALKLTEQPLAERNSFETVVIKYERDDKKKPFQPVKRFTKSRSHPIQHQAARPACREEDIRDVMLTAALSMRKINNHGVYSLCYFYFFSNLLTDTFTECSCYDPQWRVEHVKPLCFNVLTEAFAEPVMRLTTPRHLPPMASRGAGGLNRPRSRWGGMFDPRTSLADQIFTWNRESFTLTWPWVGWQAGQMPEMYNTCLLPEGTKGAVIFKSPLPETSPPKAPDTEANGQAATPGIEGQPHFRIFGDDEFLLTLMDHGYVVHSCGEKGRNTWLEEGLNRRVTDGGDRGTMRHSHNRDRWYTLGHTDRDMVVKA